MSGRRGGVSAGLRLVLASVAAVDLLSFHRFIAEARAAELADGVALGFFVDLASRPPATAGVVLLGLCAAVGFGRRAGALWPGAIVLGALAFLSTVHTQLFGSPWRHLFFSGLCLGGWLVGLAVRRARGAAADESLARTGSIAMLGAAYLSSGISKFVFGGGEWLSGLPVQAAVIGQQGMVPDGLASIYRSWVVTSPNAASVHAWATTGLELAGPLMLLGRRTRLCVALGLSSMHASIYVLTMHILYWESIVLLLSFGLTPDPPAAAGAAPAPRRRDRAFALAAAALALTAAVAIGRQALRHARLDESAGTAADLAPPPTPAPLRRVGPFAVGQAVADTWSIESIELRGASLIVTLLGEPGRASFEITCTPSAHGSPFDVGAAHVFYPNNVEYRDIESSGRALQAQLREAAAGEDVCERLRSWRAAAAAGAGEAGSRQRAGSR
jgi:hypothetical protein